MDVEASSMSLVELLPGASTLPAALVNTLESRATVHEVASGTVLLRQRAVVDQLIVLVSGRVATLVEFTGAGDLVVETTEEPGRLFGWSGLHAPERATATVRADTDCRILILPLEPVRHGPPRWTAALCALVAGCLAERTRELQLRCSGAVDLQWGRDDA
jgi:CRP-like cAMP-binding protein